MQKCRLEEKPILAAAEGRESRLWIRVRERGTHRGTHKENISPYPLAWKTRGTELREFLPPVVLKVWSFKGHPV